MEAIKSASIDFTELLSFPSDRVGIIAMTSQIPGGSRAPVVVLPLTSDKSTVQTALNNLNVFVAPDCSTTSGFCTNRSGGTFIGYSCPIFITSGDPSSCTLLDVGTSLKLAGNEFLQGAVRQDAQHVIVALTGGPANASIDETGTHPNGFCPSSTWTSPWCRDALSSTRHSNSDPNYDADDYARDMADFVKDPNTELDTKIFTIGLGSYIQNYPSSDPYSAERLLKYIALIAGGNNANHGYYYYVPDVSVLPAVFQAIADNISCPSAIVVANNNNAGEGSLRQAIADVCSGGTITFDPSLAGGTIYLASSLLIDKGLTIDGSSLASHIQISGDTNNDGTGDVRVFSVSIGVTATLDSLIITKGLVSGANGGGIYNSGTLTVTNSMFSGNTADRGGGIYNNTGSTLHVTNSSILNNTTHNDGGGIYNLDGTFNIDRHYHL